MTHRIINAALVAATIFALGALSPAHVDAAPVVMLTSTTRYEVLPAEARVHVTIDAVATNVDPATADGGYYSAVNLVLLGGASDISATAGGVSLPVAIIHYTDQRVEITVTFGVGLFYQQPYAFQVAYDIDDGAGSPPHTAVVRESFVAFPVWATAINADDETRVEIVVPAEYHVTVFYASVELEAGLAQNVYRVREIPDPFAFSAGVHAEQDVAPLRQALTIGLSDGDASVLIEAWADDPVWLERHSDAFVAGLPPLERAIGVPYPLTGTLTVREEAYRYLGTFGGLFDRAGPTIVLRHDADAYVALHEAAQAWFNRAWFNDRWILEGFAGQYATVVANALGMDVPSFELTPELTAAAIPLNRWRAATPQNPATDVDDFGYAASLQVASTIAELAGPDGLKEVWRAASAGQLAYATPGHAARLDSDPRPASWKRLLDLLENHTPVDYDPIWREWIVTDAQAGELDARDAARANFDAAVEAADDWTLPRSTRVLMDAWRFEAAEAELVDAHAILADRADLAAEASALGLMPPDDLRVAFEDEGLAAAADEVDAQQTSLGAIAAAVNALATEPDLLERVGLIGEIDPGASLAEARQTYEDGHDAGAQAAAGAAVEGRVSAPERGRLRIGAVAGALLAIDVLGVAATLLRRRRRRRAAPGSAMESPEVPEGHASAT